MFYNLSYLGTVNAFCICKAKNTDNTKTKRINFLQIVQRELEKIPVKSMTDTFQLEFEDALKFWQEKGIQQL